MNNILRFMIKKIYMMCDISIPHDSTWQLNVETSKNTKYHTDVIYYSINTIVIYKYTCTLIYNYTFTQHTHIIFSQKFLITSSVYVVDRKTCHMKQHKISHSWFSNRNIVYINIMLLVISHSHQFHHNYTNFPNIISL